MNLGNENHKIFQGDCLKVMDSLIKQGVKVDAIICDLPYGVTNNSWDTIIPFEKLWERINKIKKDAYTPIVLFAGKKSFEFALWNSNQKHFRYEWIWDKRIATGFLDAAYKPLIVDEKIFVFIEKPFENKPSKLEYKKYDRVSRYYPQFTIGNKLHSTGTSLNNRNSTYGKFKTLNEIKLTNTHKTEFFRKNLPRLESNKAYKHPKNILRFDKQKPNRYITLHPTAKPVELIEYLVKTYTNKNELVLDMTAGGGSLLEARQNTNRRSISIELNYEYICMIKQKLKENE